MKETPQQKYQRLLHEVQELTTEVEKIKVSFHLKVLGCPVWGGQSLVLFHLTCVAAHLLDLLIGTLVQVQSSSLSLGSSDPLVESICFKAMVSICIKMSFPASEMPTCVQLSSAGIKWLCSSFHRAL